ncbi:hypothetical protein V5N11_014583 [Cardamine amara subsp. amara]|uniref:Uncharacterized protein n=1 Tax=Cardamine amara subsp. amara TaxID=228776 RepID=A0ABD1BIF7_CARAN
MKGKSTVSSSEKSMSSSTMTTSVSTEDSERRDSNCYFPDCRKDANCSCEICLDSLNATLDLMPLSVQKSSLTKLSYASNFKSTVESTPTSFDPTLVTTPVSVLRVVSSSPKKKKKQVKKSPTKTTKNEKRRMIFAVILRFLEDEFKGFVNNGKFSSCRGSDSKWQIKQSGPMLNSKCVLYKSAIEEVSIWGWPLQTAGLFNTGFSTCSITVLSGRVTEWTEGRFGFTIREANTSWGKTKWSTSVLQLDPNTWVLEYSQSSVMDSSSLLSLTMDLLKHMMFQAAKNVNRELFWMFSASRSLYSEAESKDSLMTPT